MGIVNTSKLTNKERIEIFNNYQKDYRFHPYTCPDCGGRLEVREYSGDDEEYYGLIYLGCTSHMCFYMQDVPNWIQDVYSCVSNKNKLNTKLSKGDK